MASTDELARRVAALERQRRVADTLPSLGGLYGPFLGLPALRGLWLAGSADENGNVYDRSGQGRTLTYNGNPVLQTPGNLVSAWSYDGTGDYHSRADEAGLDVLGTESYVVAGRRGLTLGMWVQLDALGQVQFLGKYLTAGDQRGYHLGLTSGDNPIFTVSSDGTSGNAVGVTAAADAEVGRWLFAVGRFTPSTELALFVNGVWTRNTTSIPASIHASTAPLEIGRFNGSTGFDGRWALAFVCAANLRDELVAHLWQHSRAYLGA